MEHTPNRCILWVADKHSGKTTAAAKLVASLKQKGYTVAGILAPSIYEDGQLTGFDIIDIKTGSRRPLAVRDKNAPSRVPFRYDPEGLELGRSALSLAETKTADLVIVDEFGHLELSGQGWRLDVNSLLAQTSPPLLLVVRTDLADKIIKLYAQYTPLSLHALDPDSINKILTMLKK